MLNELGPVRLVSNRGPLTPTLDRQGWQPSSGGVAASLRRLAKKVKAEWFFPWVGSGAPTADGGSPGPEDLLLRPVTVDDRSYRLYYDEFSNRVLWFLHSGLPTALGYSDWRLPWKGYRQVNWDLAKGLATHGSHGPGVVMIQDYHLYLVAGLLRPLQPDSFYHHFIHVPWGSPEAWRAVPDEVVERLLRGLLANDRIGFQTPEDIDQFIETVRDRLGLTAEPVGGELILRYRGRSTALQAYPIGVDARSLRYILAKDGRGYRRRLAAPRLRTLVRVDRLDPAKNIERGFLAFERFLERHPEWLGQVRFLAFLVPSRTDLPEYAAYAQRVFGVVKRVNKRFGRPGWDPITVFNENNQAQALAGLSLADAILVNSISDGMNLVAKEGIAVNTRHAALILSRRAGAYQQLRYGALGINPLDLDETVGAIEKALEMPVGERELRFGLLRRQVETADLDHWMEVQLEDIEQQRRSPAVRRA